MYDKLHHWLAELTNRQVLVILVTMSIASSLISFVVSIVFYHTALSEWMGSWLQNFGTEAFGAVVTFALIELILNARERRKWEQRQTINNLTDAKQRAVEEIKEQKMHLDGRLVGENLVGMDIAGDDWAGANLERANLCHTNLERLNLSNAHLNSAKFGHARMHGAVLLLAQLADADLHDADLGWSELRGIQADRAVLRHANLNSADVRGAHLYGADLTEAELLKADLTEANLSRAKLCRARMEGVRMVARVLACQADFTAADLADAILWGGNFSGANLHEANLQGASLTLNNEIKAQFDEQTVLPDGSLWTLDTDMHRFTDPAHPAFWRSPHPESPAYQFKARQIVSI